MWTQIAGLMGASAVGAGAIGAHALPKDTTQAYRTIYMTGANYHLVHSVALLTSALALKAEKGISHALYSLLVFACLVVAVML